MPTQAFLSRDHKAKLSGDERLTVREACRRRVALDGADAQALEHALTITERERDSETARAEKAEARVAELEKALRQCIGVIGGNRLVLGEYEGPEEIARVERLARAALDRREG